MKLTGSQQRLDVKIQRNNQVTGIIIPENMIKSMIIDTNVYTETEDICDTSQSNTTTTKDDNWFRAYNWLRGDINCG